MDRRPELAAEQVRYMRKAPPMAMLANFLGICCTGFFLWKNMRSPAVAYWVAGAAAQHVLVAVLTHALFTRKSLPVLEAYRRLPWIVAIMFAQGFLWAIGIAVFFPAAPPDIQFGLLYTLALVSAGALTVSVLYFPLLLAFVSPYTVAAIAVLLMQRTALHAAFAAAVSIVAALIFCYGWHLRNLYLKSLALRFENVDLVAELTAQKEAAVAANQAKSRFLAAANNDLRQPMHALNSYLSALAGTSLPPSAHALLSNGQVCARFMDDMFRQLEDVSQLDATVLRPEIAAFPIAPMLEQLTVQLQPEAMEKGLALRCVPASSWVRSDARWVARILRNFVSNAIRYTSRGGIVVGCRRRGAHLRVSVYDTGIGIAPAMQGAIFEEFYQLGNPERDASKGLGLGLSIADRLAKLLGTTVFLRSQPGRGSVFAIDLPIAAPEAMLPTLLVPGDASERLDTRRLGPPGPPFQYMARGLSA